MSDYQDSDPGRPYHTRGQNSKNNTKKKKKNKKKTKNQGVGKNHKSPRCSPGFPGPYNPEDDDLGPPSVHFRMMYGPEQDDSRAREYAGSTSKNQLLSDVFGEQGAVGRSSGPERANWYGNQQRRGAIYPGIHNEPWETYSERTQPLRCYQEDDSYGYQGNVSSMPGSPDNSSAYDSPSYCYTSQSRSAQHGYGSDDRSRSRVSLRRGMHGFRNDHDDDDVMLRGSYERAYQERDTGRGNGYRHDNGYGNNYISSPTRQNFPHQSSQTTQPSSRPRRQPQSSQYHPEHARASDRPYTPNPNPNSNSFHELKYPPSNRQLGRRLFTSRQQQQPFWNEGFTYTPNHRSQEPLRSIYSIRNGVNEIVDMLRGMRIDVNQRYDGRGRRRRRGSGCREWGRGDLRRGGGGGYGYGHGHGHVHVRKVQVPEFRHVGDLDGMNGSYPNVNGNGEGWPYHHPLASRAWIIF